MTWAISPSRHKPCNNPTRDNLDMSVKLPTGAPGHDHHLHSGGRSRRRGIRHRQQGRRSTREQARAQQTLRIGRHHQDPHHTYGTFQRRHVTWASPLNGPNIPRTGVLFQPGTRDTEASRVWLRPDPRDTVTRCTNLRLRSLPIEMR